MEQHKNHKKIYTMDEFVEIVRILREKCPWDSTQTHETLKACLENETREVLEGISLLSETGDGDNLCEELGDLLLHIVLHSLIAEEEGLFTMEDVIERISTKMKFRHPKIFSPEDRELAALSWDELKKKEKEMLVADRQDYAENAWAKEKKLDNTGRKVYI